MDGTTPCSTGKILQNVLDWEKNSILLKCYTKNYLKANSENYHVLSTNSELSKYRICLWHGLKSDKRLLDV